MRWAFILFLATALILFPRWAASQTVTFTGKKVSLQKVFSVIKFQTGNVFFYDASLLKDAKPVSVQLKNSPLDAALTEIFKDQPFTWSLEYKTITIIKKSQTGREQLPPPHQVAIPSIQVKGIVTDGSGNRIEYVSVLVKRTGKGKLTDKNGVFIIQVQKPDVLVVSCLGYASKEIPVRGSEMDVQLDLEVKPMELLVVGGNIGAIQRKADPTSSITVLDAKTLERLSVNTLDQVFRGLVPGTYSFNVGDAPEQFPTLSIRGAASPGSLAPIAVYVDGIEYAGGSGYLCQLDKTNIDRMEIVRGPGAATMYGTGSNGGIVQIFTKRGKPGKTTLNLTSSAGFYKSKWVTNDPIQQLHNLEVMTGYTNVAFTLGGSYRSVGAYLPGGGENNTGLYGAAKIKLGKLQGNLAGRFNVRNFNYSKNPSFDTAIHPREDIIIEPIPGFKTPAYEWFNVKPRPPLNKRGLTKTYIAGINLSHKTTRHWVNNLDAGYTKNSVEELPVQDGTVPLQRQYYANTNNITTVRYSNLLSLTNYATGLATVISSGAEYKRYSSASSYTRSTAAASSISKDPDNENYGAFLQANISYKNVYLTTGMRYEKNKLFDATWNPRVGLTTNFDWTFLTLKPKISWGRGITPPSYQNRYGSPPSVFTVVYGNPEIKPQTQEGFDYGIEIYDKQGKYKFEVIRYDNVVKNMITEVSLGQDPGDPNLFAFSSANAAEVANQGWEFSGEYQVKRFNLQATFSIMNSTIKDTTGASNIYSLKDKVRGARLGNLPRHTAGLNFTYNFFRLFTTTDKGAISLSLTEVDGIQTFDYVNYALDVSYGRTAYDPDNNGYRVENSPVFRLGVNADYYITNDLRVFVQGGNILNSYKFEYSSDYPTHGATWLFGFKYNITKDN